jgi:hypothetical protein
VPCVVCRTLLKTHESVRFSPKAGRSASDRICGLYILLAEMGFCCATVVTQGTGCCILTTHTLQRSGRFVACLQLLYDLRS